MKRISVFCGSSSGNNPIFKKQAFDLGEKLAENSIDLVYGGAKVGLMGAVADGTLNKGGNVIGVLPYFLEQKELAHKDLTEIILVETMHERKAKMNELSDGVIALPGGFGTMEELFEMLTWAQLAIHNKPVAILNTDGFYNPLLSLMETMIGNGFLKNEYRNILLVNDNIDKLIQQMKTYVAPANDKWFIVK